MRCESMCIDLNGGTVSLRPVTDGSQENEKFYQYTPGGQLELATLNHDALKQFEVGKEFYVDVKPAD